MVIHILDSLIEEAKQNRKARQILKLIFFLFESGKHKWLIKGNDIELYMNLKFLSSYQEFIEKSAVEAIAYPNQD